MAPLPEALAAWAEPYLPFGEEVEAVPIAPDGSERVFYRLQMDKQTLILLYSPHNRAESLAWYHFQKHLRALGLPAPALLAADPERGLFLMADLGSVSLQQAALACRGRLRGAKLLALYQPVIKMLALLAAKGGQGLNPAWCFDSLWLDEAFLRRAEAAYFYQQFVPRFCPPQPDELQAELDLTAKRAAEAEPKGLVHRDLQSRNLVLDSAGALGLVDFQGARLGPVQYDLASLLNDPYVQLPLKTRQDLLEYYLQELGKLRPVRRAQFLDGWPWTALSRNLQVLGAYAFLSQVKGKSNFARYICPASRNLKRLLRQAPLRRHLPLLGRLAAGLC